MKTTCFEKLYIPENSFELIGEHRRLERVSAVLRRVGILPEEMVYWGGEGTEMYHGAHPTSGYQTEGLTFDCFRDLAKAVDSIGTLDEYDPFYEANQSMVPAIITYDRHFLEPVFNNAYYLWNTIDDESLLTATRAVIFFADPV